MERRSARMAAPAAAVVLGITAVFAILAANTETRYMLNTTQERAATAVAAALSADRALPTTQTRPTEESRRIRAATIISISSDMARDAGVDTADVSLMIIDTASRNVLARSPHFPEGAASVLMATHGGASDGKESSAWLESSGNRYFAVGTPAPGDSSLFVIAAARFESSVRPAAWLLVLATGFTGVFSVVILFAGVRKRLLLPLEHLRSEIGNRSGAGTYPPLLPPNPLVSRLTTTFNEYTAVMTRRLSELTHQRNELQSILTSMVEGIVVLDHSLRIRTMNAAAGRMFQRDETDAPGRTILDFCRNTELADFADTVRASSRPLERNITIYHTQPQYVQVHGISISTSDGAAVLLVLNDITRLKQLEQMRKDFVSNVSHELKTPITSIKGFVETLLDGAIEDPETGRRFLTIILSHADRIHYIIEDLLSLARLEQNDAPVRMSQVDLRDVVQASMDVCRNAASAKMIVMEDSYEGTSATRLNSNLMQQAITNLIDNAIKYSPSGSRVSVDVVGGPAWTTIAVRDTGPGIAQRDISRIFERFYRVDRARSRDVGGTGLGLAIVKHIAIAHGGEVSVESELGRGSTFTLRIPSASVTG